MKHFIYIIILFISVGSNAQVANVLTQGGVVKPEATTYKVRWKDTANYEGNSITNGGVATDSQYYYVTRVATRTGTVQNKTSVGSSSIKNIIFRRFTNMPAVGVRQSFSVMIGINDILNSTSGNKINKVSEGLKTCVVNQFLETFTPIDSSAITATGTWASLTDPNISSKSVILGRGTPKKSSVAGSKLTFTHKGDNLVIGTWGVDTSHTTFGTFKVTIDGVVMATYESKGKADDWYYAPIGTFDFRMPTVVFITGLLGGIHQVEIEVLENKEVDFDYIGRMVPPANGKSTILIHCAQTEVNPAAPAGTNAFINALNKKIDTIGIVFRDLGYPLAVAKTENYLDTTTLTGGSGIHPNDLGHFQIANAVLSVIDTTARFNLTTTGSGAATWVSGTNTLNVPTPSAAGSPAGSTGDIQIKSALGTFTANSRFNIDSTNNYMSLGNAGSTRSRFWSQQQSSTDRLVFNTGNNVHSFYMQNNGDFNIPGNLNFDGTTKGITLAGSLSQFLKMSRPNSAGAFRYEFITNNTTDYYIGYRGNVDQLTFDAQNSTGGFVFGTNLSGSFNASAIMELKSTAKGFLQPVMTNTQMNAISSPATGLSIFNTTDSSSYDYRGIGAGWSKMAYTNAANIITTNSAASTPATLYNGTWFTGGSTTTTMPHFLIEPSGTTSSSWSTSGTAFGIDNASGFAGNNIDVKQNGTSVFKVSSNGGVTATNFIYTSTIQSATAANSNLWVINPIALGAQNSTAEYQIGGNPFQLRVGIRGSTSTVATAGSDIAALLIGNNTFTEATSGTSALASGLAIVKQTFTNGSGSTTDFQNLYVDAAPTGGTNNWSANLGKTKIRESFFLPYVAKTGTYTATFSDYTIDCTSGTFTVTLPTAVGNQGVVFIIKNSGAGTITMAGTSSQTFDGVTSPTIAAGAVAQYQSNNANWIKIN